MTTLPRYMYPIQKNVPIPPMRPRGRPWDAKYPWPDLKPGDSFKVPFNGRAPSKQRTALHADASQWCKNRSLSWTFSTRIEDDGVRIWRVA